ncbi:MAG: response regulator [Syntrophomonadaceae bacterium]
MSDRSGRYNVNDCMKKISESKSDIVLIDLDLSDISTINLIGFLTEENIKVVIMAELDPKDYVPVFSQGVSGFLPKNCSPHELLEAMHDVYYNHIYLSPGLNWYPGSLYPGFKEKCSPYNGRFLPCRFKGS